MNVWFSVTSASYYKIQFFLLGEVVLFSGDYSYIFSCMLPPALPSSVEGKIGHIRYSVVVHIDRPIYRPDREFRQYFTVLKTLNLNDEIVLRVCVYGREMKIVLTKNSVSHLVSRRESRAKKIFHLLLVTDIWFARYKWTHTCWGICAWTDDRTFITNR